MKRIIKPKYVNDTALDILRRDGVFLCADCGGRGTCGKCRVILERHASYAGVSEEERKVLSEEEISSGVRLACQLRAGEMQGAEDGISLSIPESSLIRDEQKEKDIRIMQAEPLKPSEIIAVDFGTTMISGALVDLNLGITGEVSVVNHQRSYGADVVSRIRAANEGYREELRHVSEDDLAELSLRLGRDPDRARYIISGNTVMGHILSGFSCRGLGEYPYAPVDITLRRDGSMTFLPGISAFVGADIVSGICACSLDQAREPWLYVDIGTNGEMVLGAGSHMLAASAPAGPAFEGGLLSCGCPAVPGAVYDVVLTGSKAIPRVIEGEPQAKSPDPSGICGSGVIALMAGLRRNGLIDENGTLAEEFAEEGFPVSGNVAVTQKDVREIQKAKAAIRAGIETLIEESGTEYRDIRKLVIAGSFGSSIDMDSAAATGLIPEELLPVSATCGNASLSGATLYALDTGFGERLKKVAEGAETIELSEKPSFGARYISYMSFA